MLTFSVNPSLYTVHEAAYSVLPSKSVAQLDKFEQVGLSEGFTKTAEGKLPKSMDFRVGAFGYTVELNIKMANSEREVPLLTVDEIENGVRGGVADSCSREDSFDESDYLLEGWDLSFNLVKQVFEHVQEHIMVNETDGRKGTPVLSSMIRIVRRDGNPRVQTKLSKLTNKYNNLSYLDYLRTNDIMNDFLDDIGSLRGLISLILSHHELCVAVGLYDDQLITA